MNKSSQQTNPTKTAKPKNPTSATEVQPPEELKCHIHEKASNEEIFFLNVNVCITEEEVKNFGLSSRLTEYNRGYYCLFHLPTNEKDTEKFDAIFKRRYINYELLAEELAIFGEQALRIQNRKSQDFSYFWFPSKQEFNIKNYPSIVSFNGATFGSDVQFKDGFFSSHILFFNTLFKSDVSFINVTFEKESSLIFDKTGFEGKLEFIFSKFKGNLLFDGKNDHRFFIKDKSFLSYRNNFVEDGKKNGFHNIRFEPSWFVNVDATDFRFTDCKWQYLDGRKPDVHKELENLKNRGIENPKAILRIACRQLAENAENNYRFEEAKMFRQMAFETEYLERKEIVKSWWGEKIFCWEFFSKLPQKLSSLPWDFAHRAYRISSYYGESSIRATFVLLSILFISAILYMSPLIQFEGGKNGLGIAEALSFSIRVMALQRPQPFPVNGFGQIVLALETILAPLQAALLALAIRRKFMR